MASVQETLVEAEPRSPHTLESIGSITAHGALGKDFKETLGLNLFDAPIHISSQRGEDNLTTYYEATFEYDPFLGDSFLNLLKATAPNGRLDQVTGIIGDWNLIDMYRAFGSSETKRLVTIHSDGLKQHWTDFENSRKLFMAALTSGLDAERATNHFSGLVSFVDREALSVTFRKLAGRMDFYEGRGIYNDPSLPDFTATVARMMKEDGLISDRQAVRMANHKSTKVLNQAYRQEDNGYGTRYYQLLDQDQIAVAEQRYVDLKYYQINVDDHEYYIGKGIHRDKSELEQAYRQRQSKKVGPYAYSIDVSEIPTKYGSKHIYFKHTLEQTAQIVKLAPILRWATTQEDDGTVTRTLEIDAMPTLPDSTDPQIARGATVYESGLTGLICIAYLSRDVRREWPKRIGLPGGRRQQNMGAAQLPVLALMMRKQLLNNPLIEAIESVT